MTVSPLVTYDAICAAVNGRDYRWEFRDTALHPHTWEELNTTQLPGTIMLIPPVSDLHKRVADIRTYLVRWSDGQFTLERVF